MKKFLFVLAMVGLAAAGVFAQDAEASPIAVSLEGDASVRWGLDLDNDLSNGFQNGTTADATLLLAAETSRESEGEGWWGDLQVKMDALNIGSATVVTLADDASLESYEADDIDSVDDGKLLDADGEQIGYINDDGDAVFFQYFTTNDDGEVYSETDVISGEVVVEVVTARLTNGSLYIDIVKPDPSINYAEDFALQYLGQDDPRSNFTVSTFDDVWQGFAAGIDLEGMLTNAEIQVYSFDDWEEVNYDYGTAASVSLAPVPEILDVDLALYFDGFADTAGQKLGFGVQPALNLADLGLAFSVAADGEYDLGAEVFGMETAADLDYQIVEQFGISAGAYTTFDNSGADVNLPLDVKFGADAAFAPVSLGVNTYLFDLLDTTKAEDGFFWAVDADASVALTGVTLAVDYGIARNRAGAVNPANGVELYSDSEYVASWQGQTANKVTLGASAAADSELHGIDNTTLTLGWSDFEWVGDDVSKGLLYLETKITF